MIFLNTIIIAIPIIWVLVLLYFSPLFKDCGGHGAGLASGFTTLFFVFLTFIVAIIEAILVSIRVFLWLRS
jgi:hypothetical protein